MNAAEFGTIAAAIKAAWPSANIMPDRMSKDVWFTMLSDLDYQCCLAAIKQIMSTSVFAPSIAEIRKACTEITAQPEVSWDTGWMLVDKAVHRYGYMREAEAAASLPEPVREVVKRLGWQNICASENVDIIRANFRMAYEGQQKERRYNAQIPQGVLAERNNLRALEGQKEKQKCIRKGDAG